MPIPLYDATIALHLQGLTGVLGFTEKARAHCESHSVDLAELVETRLHADMLPLRFQLVSVVHHSLGALRGVQAGTFAPPRMGDQNWDALVRSVAEARDELAKLSPQDVEALEGREVVFELGELRVPFTAEGFLLSFSLPNFFFHSTTAYDILRMKGIPLGKRDFTGPLRIKR